MKVCERTNAHLAIDSYAASRLTRDDALFALHDFLDVLGGHERLRLPSVAKLVDFLSTSSHACTNVRHPNRARIYAGPLRKHGPPVT